MSLELALALSRIGRPRILIVGDYIDDIEVECQPHRFAQEAPHCPVWMLSNLIPKHTAGGAGAVCEMAKALGADAFLISSFLPHQATKTRYFVNGVQQLRIDTPARPLTDKDSERIVAHVADEVQRADCVLIADYGKGVCTDAVLRAAIDGAKARDIPCIVDPARGADWKRYAGATCIKCNHLEWHALHTLSCPVIVTKGERGMHFFEFLHHCTEYLARPRDVVDVTGAGDAVLSAIGVCIAGGMTWPDACQVANAAAGLKVERRGAVPVPKCEVVADLLDGLKIIPSELLPAISQAAKTWNGTTGKVVWANGAFDGGLHAGHLHLLAEAKRQGDVLIVGVNTDGSVEDLKGPGRPLRPCKERCEQVAALVCVDYVVSVNSQRILESYVKAVAPEVLVVGSDYRGKEVVGSECCGRVHFIERLPGHSTTECVRKLTSACERA